MTVTQLTALLVQVVTIALLRHRLGRYWLRRPVTILVLASVVYDGLSPMLLDLPSIRIWNNYRNGIQQQFVDSAMLLMSVGMLAFTIAYLLARPERSVPAPSEADIRIAVKVLDWRWLACACVPLAVLTYDGRGYNGAAAAGATTAVGANLASTFFIVLVVLTAFSFLLRHGNRWFIPVLTAQSLLLAAAGARTPVITDAVTLILLMSYVGDRPSRRQLRVTLALTLLLILSITGVRVEQGRTLFTTDSGLTARIEALGSGITALTSSSGASQAGPGLLAQAAVRLDGVDFAGGILQAESLGQSRLSATYVPESLLLAVPSVLWSSKLSHGNALNPVQLELNDFGMQQVNFLPGFTGIYMGFLSPPWLIIFLALLGALSAWGERLLFRSCTPARIALLAGAVDAALRFEGGLQDMVIALRSALFIAVVVKLIEVARAPNTLRRCRKRWPILARAQDRPALR